MLYKPRPKPSQNVGLNCTGGHHLGPGHYME